MKRMDDKERKVLNSLCNGDISFSEAALELEVSKEDIEDMMDNYMWMPSSDKIIEFCDLERETLSFIRENSQPITFKVSDLQSNLLYEQMQFTGSLSAHIPNIEFQMSLVPPQQEDVTYTNNEGMAYIY